MNKNKSKRDTLLDALIELPKEDKNKTYVDLNCFRWPKSLERFKPEEWDFLNNRERMKQPIANYLWESIHEITTNYERSEAWHMIRMGKTAEQHAAWWKNECMATS